MAAEACVCVLVRCNCAVVSFVRLTLHCCLEDLTSCSRGLWTGRGRKLTTYASSTWCTDEEAFGTAPMHSRPSLMSERAGMSFFLKHTHPRACIWPSLPASTCAPFPSPFFCILSLCAKDADVPGLARVRIHAVYDPTATRQFRGSPRSDVPFTTRTITGLFRITVSPKARL